MPTKKSGSSETKKTTHSRRSRNKKTAPLVEGVASTVSLIPSTEPSTNHKSMMTVVVFTVVGAVAVAGCLALYQVAYAGRVFPGVHMGSLALGGMTQDQVSSTVRDKWDVYSKAGIPLNVEGQQVVLSRVISSPTDPDLTFELYQLSSDSVGSAAFAVGREGNWLWRLIEPVTTLVNGSNIQPQVTVDIDRVAQFVKDTVPTIEHEPEPAKIQVDLAGNVQVVPEQAGDLIALPVLGQDVINRASIMSREPITVSVTHMLPVITEAKLAGLLPQARAVIAGGAVLKFTYEKETWEAKPEVWQNWLGARERDSGIELGFTAPAADEYFLNLAKEIDQPARDAKFEVQDGRVAAFQSAQSGIALNQEAAREEAENVLLRDQAGPVQLQVQITNPKITTAQANNLGIQELIGVGTSNFSGSPKNRRHNIKVGADTLNGLLVKPGEAFSLLAALGEIDGEHGYLQELVIKGNKTIPEYGGGLCQIGTTTFRAALASGLPIVERRNHSYRVVYYEPAGTDATIYDPAPDFKFQNDTPNTILIQTKIDGDNLIFEFWGTSDKRKVEQTKPKIFNIVAPPPTKLIETEDLEPGEKKCTERAHNGADAEFTYTVTYASGEQKQEVFKSHYIPWQEVCLVGVPKGTLNPPESEVLGETTEQPADTTALPTPDTVGQQGAQ